MRQSIRTTGSDTVPMFLVVRGAAEKIARANSGPDSSTSGHLCADSIKPGGRHARQIVQKLAFEAREAWADKLRGLP